MLRNNTQNIFTKSRNYVENRLRWDVKTSLKKGTEPMFQGLQNRRRGNSSKTIIMELFCGL